jgi:signal peptidase II
MPEGAAAVAAPARGGVSRGLIIAVATLVLDQATKWWILAIMLPRPPYERVIPVLPSFDLVLLWNRGVSFGLFNNDSRLNAVIFSALAAAIVVGLFVWLRRASEPLIIAGLGLVIGGAVGNVIDRLVHGAVVDFLDFYIGAWHWPAFNIADAAICVGVVALVLDGLLPRRDRRS